MQFACVWPEDKKVDRSLKQCNTIRLRNQHVAVIFITQQVEEDCRVKRQKRDRLERAHAQGYRAGVAGRSKEICPYQGLDTRSQWLGGWREAIEDRNVGLFNKGQ